MDALATILAVLILVVTPVVLWLEIRAWRESKRRMRELVERNQKRVARWEED